MARGEPHVCGRCPSPEPPVKRCTRCKRRRTVARQELRAQKRADHICEDCTAPAERASDGSYYTRCKKHRLANNALSSASHAR